MILDCLNAVPEDGSTPAMDIGLLHVEVQEIKDRRIEWALVSKIQVPEVAEDSKEKTGEKRRITNNYSKKRALRALFLFRKNGRKLSLLAAFSFHDCRWELHFPPGSPKEALLPAQRLPADQRFRLKPLAGTPPPKLSRGPAPPPQASYA